MHKERVNKLDSMTLPCLIVFNENLGVVVQYIQSVRYVTNMKRINHFQNGSIPVLHDGVRQVLNIELIKNAYYMYSFGNI